MGCIGAMDGTIGMCPDCYQLHAIDYHKWKDDLDEPECSKCMASLDTNHVITVGVLVEGEQFYYTSKGNEDAVHISKRDGETLYNKNGKEIHKRSSSASQ